MTFFLKVIKMRYFEKKKNRGLIMKFCHYIRVIRTNVVFGPNDLLWGF